LAAATGPSGGTGRRRDGRESFDDLIDLFIHHLVDEIFLLPGCGMGDGHKRRVRLPPSVHARLPSPGKAPGGNGYGGDTGLLNGNHVMGKPRRATASMGRGPDHGVYLCRNQRRFIIVDVDAAT
jgi:hypothetical protein